MKSSHVCRPIIIIGAPRSGTNMLRDSLCALPGYVTWPCDEINYIWRHGNRSHPTDEFPASFATPQVCSFVRRQFENILKKQKGKTVVEKTCANSLRVPFTNIIFPQARYLFLFRDGRDVVASAMKKWNTPPSWRYLVAKLRFLPLHDLPFYGMQYLLNRFQGILGWKHRLASWGPKFKDMEAIGKFHGLAEVCAAQWSRSVSLAEEAYSALAKSRACRIQYEKFVSQPDVEFRRIVDFLEVQASQKVIDRVSSATSAASVGKWRNELDELTLKRIQPFLEKSRNLGHASRNQ